MFMNSDQERRVQKNVPDNVCARCRQPFAVGDRIQHAFILYDPQAYNPEKVTERGISLGTDCEFVHCSCQDPGLTGKLAAQLRSNSGVIL